MSASTAFSTPSMSLTSPSFNSRPSVSFKLLATESRAPLTSSLPREGALLPPVEPFPEVDPPPAPFPDEPDAPDDLDPPPAPVSLHMPSPSRGWFGSNSSARAVTGGAAGAPGAVDAPSAGSSFFVGVNP